MKVLFSFIWTDLLQSDHVKVVLVMENQVDAHLLVHVHTLQIKRCIKAQYMHSKLKELTVCF